MAEIAEDDRTKNTDIGQASQTGFLDFWAIATDQSVYWPKPLVATRVHQDANLQILTGLVTTDYVNNNSLNATLTGIKVDLTTPAVVSFDTSAGSKIDINLLEMKASTNRARLAIGKVTMNQTLQARLVQDKVKASISEMNSIVNNLKSGLLGAALAEKIRL